VGKGWAILLNRTFDGYPPLRASGYGGAGYRDLLRTTFGGLGIAPTVAALDATGQAVPGVRIARYRFGGADVIALLQESLEVATVYGRVGVTAFDDDARRAPVARQEVVISLPRLARTVDARTGRDLGRTDTVRIDVTPGDAVILAQTDAAAALTVEGPPAARRGDHATFALGLAGPGPHLVRAHVHDPDGRFLPEYAANVLVDGDRGQFVLPTAVSDAPGRYRVVVTDVITGATARAELILD
jgi:hypothetical protein